MPDLNHYYLWWKKYIKEIDEILDQSNCCYDWVSSEEGKTSETGRSAELAFVQRDWS